MYNLSTDYDTLFELIKAGNIAFGLVHYCSNNLGQEIKDVCQIKRLGPYQISIHVRGITYAAVYQFHQDKGEEMELFRNICKSVNLEWVHPHIEEKIAPCGKGRKPIDRRIDQMMCDGFSLIKRGDEPLRLERGPQAYDVRGDILVKLS